MITPEQLRQPQTNSVLFECVAGSRAYGTATAWSDEDLRGIYASPAASYLALTPPPEQVSDESGNTVYCSLRRFIELLSVANPNILELLFMPEDCVRRMTPVELAVLDELLRKSLDVNRKHCQTPRPMIFTPNLLALELSLPRAGREGFA